MQRTCHTRASTRSERVICPEVWRFIGSSTAFHGYALVQIQLVSVHIETSGNNVAGVLVVRGTGSWATREL